MDETNLKKRMLEIEIEHLTKQLTSLNETMLKLQKVLEEIDN